MGPRPAGSVLRGFPAAGRLRLVAVALSVALLTVPGSAHPHSSLSTSAEIVGSGNTSAVANFSAAIGRLVTLVALAGSGLLALVWARVAMSWFSHDITKKVQAKDRARDALIGTLLFVAAISGLIWGLAHWVLTGT
jgi:hypothetical protein